MRRVALPLLIALAGCGRLPPPAPAAPSAANASAAEPTPYVGPLVRLPKDTDVVSLINAPVRPDGVPDVCFRVRLSGRVRALDVTWTDAEARRVLHVHWDTRTRHEPLPAPISFGFSSADQSAVLAVVDAHGKLLNPDGELPETVFRDEEVRLYMADPQGIFFVPGRAYTLWVERPGGTLDHSTIIYL